MQVGCSLAVLEGAFCFQPHGCKGGRSLRSSSQTEQQKKLIVVTFFRKKLSCPCLPQANQLGMLSSPPLLLSPAIKPCTLLKNRGLSLFWDIFFPCLFSFWIESCPVVVEDRGLPHLFLPFTFPSAKLRLKSCRFLQILNLEQASYPTELCGTWVLQILPVLEFWQHQSLILSLREGQT